MWLWTQKESFDMKNTLKRLGLLVTVVIAAIALFSLAVCDTPSNEAPSSDPGKEGETTFTVRFDRNGGRGTVPGPITAAAGSSITLPDGDGLSKSGYVFGGWNTQADGVGTNYDEGESFTVTGNVTLYARWIAEGTTNYTITFNLNGGGGTTPAAQTVNAGSSITLPNYSGFFKTSYTFGGWNTEPDGMGTNYAAGSSFTPIHDITLYAKWIAEGTTNYTITFNLNGGSGATPAAQTVNAGSSITLPNYSGFFKTSYTFGGWNTNADGAGTDYNAGASYTVDGDVTLYARWVADNSAPQTVISAEIIVTAPVKSAIPDTAANGTGNFTISAVSWSPEDNPFLGGAVYTATVTLTADSRYTFTGLSFATINGQNAAVSNNTGTAVTLSYTFPATDTRTVTDIAIKTQPNKLIYTHGDPLDLTGLAVTLTHDDASTEDVAAAGFTAKNITVNPAHGDHLVHLEYNGQPVTIIYGSLTPLTTNNLTVNPKVITFTVNSIPAQTYNGSAHTPAVTVRDGATTLTLTADYTVTYTDNTNAGTATVTITGAGNYAGSSGSVTFTINKAAGAAVNAPASTLSVTTNSITINAVTEHENGQTVEYAISTSNSAPSSGWQTGTAFSGLTAGTTYYIFARSAQNTNYNAGAASAGYLVTTHKYSISLNPTTHTFTAATYGYGAQSARSVTVSNTGNQATGALAVALSGTNAGYFTLSTTSINSITAGGTDSFTVVPNTGLNAGTTAYTATVTVSGSNGISATLSVGFTVNRANGAAVSAPTGTSSVTSTGITVNAVTAPANGQQTVEYAISLSNSAPSSGWQTGRTFSGLMYETRYYIFARSAQSTNYNAGTASSGYSVTTTSPIGNEVDPFPLTANQWKDGNLTTSGGEVWYSFTAVANTTYYVWWNESYQGDGTKTLDVRVRAYNSNGTELFSYDGDYAWNSPYTISVPSSGTIYLRVTAYSEWSTTTGTFAIVYSSIWLRPGLSPTSLTANQWRNGSIDSPPKDIWYSFTAAANTTYYVWWNDSYQGDGTKTLDVRVDAYNSNGTELFSYDGDSAWDGPYTISVPSSGTIYLRVTAYNQWSTTGTFAIVYSSGSTRPTQ